MTAVLNTDSRNQNGSAMNALESKFDKSTSLTDSGISTPASGIWYTTNENAMSPLNLTTVVVEPVGRWFEQHAIHKLLHIDPVFHNKFALILSRSGSAAVSGAATPNDSESEEETPEILAANPANWRHQDHYAVLGIGRKRWSATDDDLRRAYRRKVLKHHPDKLKQAAGVNADASTKAVLKEESAHFKCVQNAYDLLLDPIKRHQFDSVDPTFDEAIPDDKIAIPDEQHFYDIFRPLFESNARFLQQSIQQQYRDIGDETTSDAQVERFYSAWFHFESWRSFEYWDFLDEKDNPEKADSRDERRYLERKFKARHDKKKKEDNARLVRLVELAYKLDPRMRRLRNRAKQEKEDIRLRREEEKMNSMKGENAAKEEAAKLLKEQEETKKQMEEDQKKLKETLKKERQKLKKTLRQLFKCCDYFYIEEKGLSAKEQERRSDACWVRYEAWLEKICEKWSMEDFKEHIFHSLNVFNGIEGDGTQDSQSVNLKEEKASDEVKLRVKSYLDACILAEEQSEKKSINTSNPLKDNIANPSSTPWTEKEVESLILAVKSFPAGVRERWHRIAEFIGQHANLPIRHTEDVVTKSKSLLSHMDGSAPVGDSGIHLPKGKTIRMDEPTVRDVAETEEESSNWTAEQQAMLEEALKKFPSSDTERWDHISHCVAGKSKNACLARFKYLADRIKSKKAEMH